MKEKRKKKKRIKYKMPADWAKLAVHAEPLDFLAAFVSEFGDRSRRELDKKLQRIKKRAEAKHGLTPEKCDTLRLADVPDKRPSRSEIFKLTVCNNFQKCTPAQVVDEVRRAYATTGSQIMALHNLRAFARRFYPEIPKEWVDGLVVSRDEVEAHKKAYQHKLIARADAPIQVSALNLWAKMHAWVRSEDPARIACALLMSTGRRTTEILKSAKFKPMTEAHAVKSKYWVAFTGQAKKRKREGSAKAVWYDVPCLLPPHVIFKAVATLRAKITPDDFKRMRDVELPRLIKARFGSTFTARVFRAVYAVVTHAVFRPMVAVNRWTQLILGHASINISQAYLNVYVYDLESVPVLQQLK